MWTSTVADDQQRPKTNTSPMGTPALLLGKHDPRIRTESTNRRLKGWIKRGRAGSRPVVSAQVLRPLVSTMPPSPLRRTDTLDAPSSPARSRCIPACARPRDPTPRLLCDARHAHFHFRTTVRTSRSGPPPYVCPSASRRRPRRAVVVLMFVCRTGTRTKRRLTSCARRGGCLAGRNVNGGSRCVGPRIALFHRA